MLTSAFLRTCVRFSKLILSRHIFYFKNLSLKQVYVIPQDLIITYRSGVRCYKNSKSNFI